MVLGSHLEGHQLMFPAMTRQDFGGSQVNHHVIGKLLGNQSLGRPQDQNFVTGFQGPPNSKQSPNCGDTFLWWVTFCETMPLDSQNCDTDTTGSLTATDSTIFRAQNQIYPVRNCLGFIPHLPGEGC